MDTYKHYILAGWDLIEVEELRKSDRFSFSEEKVRLVGPFTVRMGSIKYRDKDKVSVKRQGVVIHWSLAPNQLVSIGADGLTVDFLLSPGSAERVLNTENEKEFDKLQSMVYSMVYHTMSCKYMLSLMEQVWQAGVTQGRKERSMEFLRLLFEGREVALDKIFDWWERGG